MKTAEQILYEVHNILAEFYDEEFKRNEENAKINNLNLFEYQYVETMEELRVIIKNDEGKCVQQVAFSTFHNALTQINFTRRIIRSNIKI